MPEPKLTLLIDTERSYLSVANLVRSEQNLSGRVIRVRADSYDKVCQAVELIRRHKLPQWAGGPAMTAEDWKNLGMIAFDTASRLADITRRGIISPTGDLTSLWNRRDALTPAPRDWGTMSDMLARIFEPTAAFVEEEGYKMLILMHERKITEEGTNETKGGPDANAKLLSEVVENSDYVWRIWREEAAQRIDGQLYPKRTHFLRLTTSENKITKMRLPMEFSRGLIENVPNPTLGRVFEILGPFAPMVFTVYGPAGAGKTTFACSLSDPLHYNKKEEVK